MIKANHKQLKTILALGVRKLSPFFLVLKLSKFPFFDNFFPDLAGFRDLDNFWDLDNFPIFKDFLYFLINL